MPSSGTKRPAPPADERNERRDRPRDWRDAHFADRDGEREASRNGHSRHRRERSRDDRYDRHDRYERDRYDRHGHSYRDSRSRERDRKDVGYDRHRDYRRDDRRHDRTPRRSAEREEGEIESPPKESRRLSLSRSPIKSPMRSPARLPPRSPARLPSRSPARSSGRSPAPPMRSPARPPVSIPTEPRPREEPGRPPREPVKTVKIAVPGPASAADEPELEPFVEEIDEEKRIEERRKKREALLAKYRAGEGPKPSLPGSPASPASPAKPSAAQSPASTGTGTGGVNSETGATPLMQNLATNTQPTTPNTQNASLAPTPVVNGDDLSKPAGAEKNDGEGVSAAEYDERAKGGDKALPADVDQKKAEEDEWEEVEIEVSDDDDEEMDMFAAFGEEETPKKKRKVKVRRRKGTTGTEAIEYLDEKPKSAAAAALEVVDNVDDTEGYYRITPGEILDDGRYQITVTLGKGMFSAVVKAKVLKAVGQERHQDVVGREVAIKVMRSQESMYVAGRKEAQVLKLLNEADPGDKKHIVRMERTFEHKGHFCIVTESLSMNLRDVIKRFGKDVGLNMKAVRAYGHQMLLALSLMRRCNIVHADIKPDNVLVSENKAVLKVCDLGTAAEVSAGEITPYLVSRFYRAPEIILGLPYDTAIDMWAVGCTLYELYTGKILFPGRSNNHMLLCMMETKGKIPNRLIKKASLGHDHFDENMNFISVERDRITGADVVKTVVINKPSRDLRSRLMPSSSAQMKMPEAELRQIQQFIDLLDKCLALDPLRRISPREALNHPFITGQ